MGKVAIYCRVSSEEQAERGTIEVQIDYAKRYLELHGAENGITEHEFYLDDGVSGTVPLLDRPGGARLIADARAGKFKALFVYRLDRLARSVKHVLDTYEILESKKIALKSMTEAFDTGTPTGKFFMTLLASIAALERDTIMERTQLGKDRGARQGRWVSGAPPFGYRIGEAGRLEIFEEEAETVRMIFDLYFDGYSTIDLAKYLNARGIATPAKSKNTKNNSTGKWHAGHISIILRNRAYMGEYEYLKRSKLKKKIISVNIPVIINNDKFRAVDRRLLENADAARGSRGRNYFLRGLIYCGNCNRAMVGSSGDSKSGRVYYRCTGSVDTGAGKRCDAKMIRAKEIENATWQDIQEFLKNPGKIVELMDKRKEIVKESIHPSLKELDGVEEAIGEKQAARSKVIALCTRGLISDLEAENELKNLSEELSLLTARRDHLFEMQDAVFKLESKTIEVRTVLENLSKNINNIDEETQAEIIRTFVDRITVATIVEVGKKKNIVEIEYVFTPSDPEQMQS